MDLEQRQMIVDTICSEWDELGMVAKAENGLESRTVYERVVEQDERISHSEFMEFLQNELVDSGVVRGLVFAGNVRITWVMPEICEEPLNY